MRDVSSWSDVPSLLDLLDPGITYGVDLVWCLAEQMPRRNKTREGEEKRTVGTCLMMRG
jgi:hypothetical protein